MKLLYFKEFLVGPLDGLELNKIKANKNILSAMVPFNGVLASDWWYEMNVGLILKSLKWEQGGGGGAKYLDSCCVYLPPPTHTHNWKWRNQNAYRGASVNSGPRILLLGRVSSELSLVDPKRELVRILLSEGFRTSIWRHCFISLSHVLPFKENVINSEMNSVHRAVYNGVRYTFCSCLQFSMQPQVHTVNAAISTLICKHAVHK